MGLSRLVRHPLGRLRREARRRVLGLTAQIVLPFLLHPIGPSLLSCVAVILSVTLMLQTIRNLLAHAIATLFLALPIILILLSALGLGSSGMHVHDRDGRQISQLD